MLRGSFIRNIILFTLGLVTLAQVGAAQETINSASVSGRVTDPSGAVVENARVTARQTETNLSRATITDRDGRFRFPYLRLGPYEITVRRPGFAEAKRSVTLTVGSAFELPISLAVAAEATTVNVSGEAAVLEAARSQIAGTVPQTEVQNLPLNGRNFLDLALLVPGVSPTNTASSQLFAETSAVPGQGISVGSQRNFSNSFIVDGLSANDDAAGLSGIFYGLDVVNEFQVVTSGGQAEFGRALGGYINVVTKSGTNTLHGDLYGYFRNQRLNANNALSGARLPLTQAQYGVSLGGPAIPRPHLLLRQFRTSRAESIRPHHDRSRRASPPSTPGWPRPATRARSISTGLYPNPVHNSNFLAKLDHQFSAGRSVQRPLQSLRCPAAGTRAAPAR